MNPLNPEAGDTPAPSDPALLAIAERSAAVVWRAVPYFGWRFSGRGRAFGRSDAGYLLTLPLAGDHAAHKQVAWLAGVLAPRGLPSLLLELQLEHLGRIARRRARAEATMLLALAASLRDRRVAALDPEVFSRCEELCRRAAAGARQRRGAGLLIASAVADGANGLGEHAEALVRWLTEACPGEEPWAAACAQAHRLAMSRLTVRGGAP